MIAVGFASRGDLISVAGDVDDRLRGRGLQGASTGAGGATSSAPPSSAPPSTPTSEATPGADLPDLPGPQLITSLTGGDPAAFCATEPQTLTDIGAFAAAAALTETGGHVGTVDLVFAPTLVRALGSTMASAPAEVLARLRPLRQRAEAAPASLAAHGVGGDVLDHLADGETAALAVAWLGGFGDAWRCHGRAPVTHSRSPAD